MEINSAELENGGTTYQDSPGWVTTKKVLYTFSALAMSMCRGAHSTLYPVILAKIYGTQGGVLAFIIGYLYDAIGSGGNTLGVKLLFEKVGFKGMSFIWGTFSIISMIILLTSWKGSKAK